MSSDQIALLDMDGTLADYDEALNREMAKLAAPGEPDYANHHGDDVPPHIEARRALIKKTPGFWRNLKSIDRGFQIVEEIRKIGFECHILTKGPTRTPSAWTEKLEWCPERIPDAAVTITQEKSLVYGRVLVDDFPPYFLNWLSVRPRGLVISVAQPWNIGADSHPNVIRYDGTNLKQVQEALQIAYDRSPNEIRPFR